MVAALEVERAQLVDAPDVQLFSVAVLVKVL